jgi:hypothetical protein
MATPPMLRSSEASATRRSVPDPLVALNVGGLVVVALGLLLAGILAVYDYSTPGAEAPLVLWVAAIAVALFVVDIAVVGVRHVRRLRLGA